MAYQSPILLSTENGLNLEIPETSRKVVNTTEWSYKYKLY